MSGMNTSPGVLFIDDTALTEPAGHWLSVAAAEACSRVLDFKLCSPFLGLRKCIRQADQQENWKSKLGFVPGIYTWYGCWWAWLKSTNLKLSQGYTVQVNAIAAYIKFTYLILEYTLVNSSCVGVFPFKIERISEERSVRVMWVFRHRNIRTCRPAIRQ